MNKITKLVKAEPAALIGLALTVVVAVVDHFAHVTDGQWQHLVDLAPVASGVLTRFGVSPAVSDKVSVVLEAIAEAEQEASTAQKRLADLRAAVAPAVIVAEPVGQPVQAGDVAPVAEVAPVVAVP